MLPIFRLPLLISSLLLPQEIAGSEILASWVQYATDGGLTAESHVEVRAVINGTVGELDCPPGLLFVDGKSTEMILRVGPTEDHPDIVCTAKVGKGVKTITLDGEYLPVPVEDPKRIVVVGDTGCRLGTTHGGLYQSCRNPSLWPFARIATSIQTSNPDLIVYTGDTIYREAPCPDGIAGCLGSPWGDILPSWEADWFGPGVGLFKAAPIIITRGNHEICKRAGTGFYRYLHAGPYTACVDTNFPGTPPWIVTLKTLQIGIMDETTDTADLIPDFQQMLNFFDDEFDRPAWIVGHRTFWGFGTADGDTEGTTTITPTGVLQEAVRLNGGEPKFNNLMVGAHVHMAEMVGFDLSAGQDRSPQLLVANGGTQLIAEAPTIPTEIDGVKVKDTLDLYQYGFVLMTRVDKDSTKWGIEFKERDGRTLARCHLKDRDASCDSSSPTSSGSKRGGGLRD